MLAEFDQTIVIKDRGEKGAELREQLTRYQVLERETTDPATR